ncbi:MAG: lipase family protein [Bacteroidales bacterium]|nr:lipase family protein [Bacteroidales bacterium]
MKVIIGIHGLDNKPERELLKNWWEKAIKEGLERIGYNGKLPHFELVYWADIVYAKPVDFEDPFISDDVYTRSPGKVNYSGTQIILSSILSRSLKKIWRSAYGSKAMGHIKEWLDPLVRKYFHEVDIYLFNSELNKRKQIKERLLETLYKFQKDEIFLIGHSMGSVIAYDVLLTEQNKLKIDTLVTLGSPLGFPYIAEKLATANQLPIFPSIGIPTPNSISKRWYNFYDSTDVIALKHKLSEIYSPNISGIAPIDKQVVNDYLIRGQRNPHNVFGYLRAKEFTMLLLSFMSDMAASSEIKKNFISKFFRFFLPVKSSKK